MKTNRAVAFRKNAVMDMGMDLPAPYLALDVAADRDIVLGALAVGNAGDVLFNDRTFSRVAVT